MQNNDRIRMVFSEVFSIPDKDIPVNASQQNFPAWDSLQHLNFIIALETEFDLSFEPDEIVAMTSLEEISKTIDSRK